MNILLFFFQWHFDTGIEHMFKCTKILSFRCLYEFIFRNTKAGTDIPNFWALDEHILNTESTFLSFPMLQLEAIALFRWLTLGLFEQTDEWMNEQALGGCTGSLYKLVHRYAGLGWKGWKSSLFYPGMVSSLDRCLGRHRWLHQLSAGFSTLLSKGPNNSEENGKTC